MVTREQFLSTGELSLGLLVMVGKIALVIFSIEIAIMISLSLWDVRGLGVAVNVLDPVTLTLLASPIIYLWVARPFAEAAPPRDR
jgi:hypothetical protein